MSKEFNKRYINLIDNYSTEGHIDWLQQAIRSIEECIPTIPKGKYGTKLLTQDLPWMRKNLSKLLKENTCK